MGVMLENLLDQDDRKWQSRVCILYQKVSITTGRDEYCFKMKRMVIDLTKGIGEKKRNRRRDDHWMAVHRGDWGAVGGE